MGLLVFLGIQVKNFKVLRAERSAGTTKSVQPQNGWSWLKSCRRTEEWTMRTWRLSIRTTQQANLSGIGSLLPKVTNKGFPKVSCAKDTMPAEKAYSYSFIESIINTKSMPGPWSINNPQEFVFFVQMQLINPGMAFRSQPRRHCTDLLMGSSGPTCFPIAKNHRQMWIRTRSAFW